MLTIAIPTLDRPAYLQRAVAYASARFQAGQIQPLVLDGSLLPENQDRNRALCSSSGIEYRHFKAELNFYERVLSGLESVGTPYVMILGDDDFIEPAAALACVDFLASRPDYVACTGEGSLFYEYPAPSSALQLIWGRGFALSYDHEDPYERIFWALCEVPPTFVFSVYKTEELVDILRGTVAGTANSPLEFDHIIGDALLISLACIRGKHGNIKRPLLLRQKGQSTPQETVLFGRELFDGARDVHSRYAPAHARRWCRACQTTLRGRQRSLTRSGACSRACRCRQSS